MHFFVRYAKGVEKSVSLEGASREKVLSVVKDLARNGTV